MVYRKYCLQSRAWAVPFKHGPKTSICSYWQRLKHSTNNVLLREAFQYATKNTPFFNIQQNEEINKKCKVKEPGSNPATHKECTISYKENPQGSISTELARNPE